MHHLLDPISSEPSEPATKFRAETRAAFHSSRENPPLSAFIRGFNCMDTAQDDMLAK
jgi:hypothetical protein